MGSDCESRQCESPQGWSLGSRAARPGLRFQTRYPGTKPLSHNQDHCAPAPALASSQGRISKEQGYCGSEADHWVEDFMVGKDGLAPLTHSQALSHQVEESAQKVTAVPTPIMPLGTLALPGTYSVKGPAPSQAPAGFPIPRQGH